MLRRTYLRFHYVQISLALPEATDYVQAGSVLGAALASVMHLPAEREAQIALHLACLRRVRQVLEAGQVDDAHAFLLVNLIATYLPLSAAEQETIQLQLQEKGDPTMEVTELTWADRLLQQGEQRGMREAIRQMLRVRFGRVSPEVEAALAQMTREEDLATFIARRGGTERGRAACGLSPQEHAGHGDERDVLSGELCGPRLRAAADRKT